MKLALALASISKVPFTVNVSASVVALQKSDSLMIAVLAKAMGLNGYCTHSLAKCITHCHLCHFVV